MGDDHVDELQRTGGMIIVTKRGNPVARLTAPPAEHAESVFGRQKGSVTILGDIVHADAVYADGIGEMEAEWDCFYGRKGLAPAGDARLLVQAWNARDAGAGFAR